jgi:phosphatidylserine decarboxylase
MSNIFSIKYFDRADKMLKTERVYADAFLYWLYNSKIGSMANHLVFRQKYISQLYGWINKQWPSKNKIEPFIQKMKVNEDELICPIEDFKSFNDFFMREIDLSKRHINPSPHVCISPVDGKLLAYQTLEPDMPFRIKRNEFNLRSFLCDKTLADKYSEGSMVVSRLCLKDYHHFHFPVSGFSGKAISIKGKYYVSGPYNLRKLIPFFSENYRMLTIFYSDHFGQIVIVEIGAFTVGSIQQTFPSMQRVAKGDRKGYFEMGGSTVVLLFKKGRIELDTDLCANTKNDIETYVLMGDSIGSTFKK